MPLPKTHLRLSPSTGPTPGEQALRLGRKDRQRYGVKSWSIALGLVLAALVGPAAHATVLDWTIGVDGNIANAANYTQGQTPASGDTLVLTGLGANLPSNYNVASSVQLFEILFDFIGSKNFTIGGSPISLGANGYFWDPNTTAGTDNVNVSVALNGGATFNPTGTTILSINNGVTGTGPLTLQNDTTDDALQLGGSSTYTGSTLVTSTGRVQVNANGAIPTGSAVVISSTGGIDFNAGGDVTIGSLAGTGTVTLGGSHNLFVGGNNTSTTFSGVYSGVAQLVKNGTGTFTLSGINTYIGGTTLDAGLTNFNSGSALGTGNVTLNGGGLQWATSTTTDISSRLALQSGGGALDTNGNNVSFGSALPGGNSGLTKAGNGTLTLSVATTYSGNFTVTGGLINFNAASALGSGNVTLNGGGLQWATATTTDISAQLAAVGAGGGTIDTNGNNVSFATGLSGTGGLTKTGTGNLTLDSTNTYAGATLVSGGTLQVGDASHAGARLAGSATVGASGTLTGHGTVSGSVTNTAGGTVAPGGSIGTLSISGSYTQGAGSTLQVELSPSTGSELAVTGSATLAGTLSVVADAGSYPPGTTYTIITGSVVSGTFNGLANGATITAGGVNFTLSYGSGSVTLTVPAIVTTTSPSTPYPVSVGVPANGTYTPGQTLDFTLTFGQTVVVAGPGTPEMEIMVGSAVRYASYVSGSGSAALVFAYTVQPGDSAPNGIALVSPALGNGATVQAASGTGGVIVASLAFRAPGTSGILVGASGTVAATVTLGGLAATYTGSPLSATASTVPPGLTVSLTYNGSTAPPAQAGSYALVGTVTNSGYSGSASGIFTINPAPQTVTFAQSAVFSNAAPFILQAAASSQLPVTFSLVSGPASLNGSTVTLTGSPGIVTVQANQGGNSNYLAAPVATVAFNVVAPAPLLDVSIYGNVGAAQNAVVAGFVIAGSGTEPVVVRGVGPTLGSFGVSGALSAPLLQLYGGSTLLLSNSGWGGSSALASLLSQVGAFPFTPGGIDAAASTTLSPGSYTLVISGVAGATGTTLAEVYDASPSPLTQASAVVNVSSLGQVSPGSPLTAGFVIGGSAPQQLLIRGVGPGLGSWGLTGVLAATSLNVYTGTGALLAQNAGWGTPVTVNSSYPGASAAAISSAASTAGAFGLGSGSRDSAVLVTLPPGSYSVQVSAAGGPSGTGLIEVYAVP